MTRMYDVNLNDNNGNKYQNNQNLAAHMEEEDGIYNTAICNSVEEQHGGTTRIDAAYRYHPNHVIPRKKKTRQQQHQQQHARTMYTCWAVFTSSSSSSSSRPGHTSNTKQQRSNRRSIASLIVFLIVCVTVVAVWQIQESMVVSNTGSGDDSNNSKLPKIIQFDHNNDPNYYEPETKVIIANGTNPVVAMKACTEIIENPSLDVLQHNVSWVLYGQELVQHISEKHGMANSDGGQYSKHYGYGNNVILNADGTMMAISYEGVAGFDKAFGAHIDIVRFDVLTQQWVLEQTVTDVQRNQGHTINVLFQSMIVSYDGQRIFFADGHGVNVFVHDPTKQSKLPWSKYINIPDPYVQYNNSKQYQFGIDLATNCDGTIIAIAGTTQTYSYTRIYQEDPSSGTYNMIGEIQNVRFGGTIVMDQSGTRLVIGTVASEGWRGMVQVFDYERSSDGSTNHHQWIRVGQPIVGKQPLDMWGGKVALSYDGTIIGVTSKNGDTNHVQVYQLSTTTTTTTVNGNNKNPTAMWVPLGQELMGTDNNPYEHFGSDLAISADGTVLAVGAPGDNELYNTMITDGEGKVGSIPSKDRPYISGRIYMYQISKSSTTTHPSLMNATWVRIDHGELHSTVIGKGDLYGQSISLSSTGNVVVGGAPRRTGKAYQHILGGVHAYQITIL